MGRRFVLPQRAHANVDVDFRKELNDQQYAVATCGEGPKLVIAGGICTHATLRTKTAKGLTLAISTTTDTKAVSKTMSAPWPAVLGAAPMLLTACQ